MEHFFQNEKHQSYSNVVVSRLGDDNETVTVPDISIPPLDDFKILKRDEYFSLFIDKHRKLAGRLIEIFISK